MLRNGELLLHADAIADRYSDIAVLYGLLTRVRRLSLIPGIPAGLVATANVVEFPAKGKGKGKGKAAKITAKALTKAP